MEITVKYKKEDIIEFQKYSSYRITSKNITNSNWVMFIPTAALILNLYYIGNKNLFSLNIIIVFIFFIWFFKNTYKSNKKILKEMLNAYPYYSFDKESKIEIYDDKIIIKDGISTSEYENECVKEVVEHKSYIFILMENLYSIIIPKRDISEIEVSGIIKKLNSKIKRDINL